MKKLTILPIALIALALTGCNPGNSADYTKAPVQTGGPEQGEWRNDKGTVLSLNSGQFTYAKDGGAKSTGRYTIDGTKITLSGDPSAPGSANWPDPNGPITVNGEQLVKTD
jgi:hypothetical protein